MATSPEPPESLVSVSLTVGVFADNLRTIANLLEEGRLSSVSIVATSCSHVFPPGGIHASSTVLDVDAAPLLFAGLKSARAAARAIVTSEQIQRELEKMGLGRPKAR